MLFAIKRKKKRSIRVGNVPVGGENPISVQSMTNTFTHDVSTTVEQIARLEAVGCEIVRVAVPDEESAGAISAIKQRIRIPLIADIHFDYRLAIAAIQSGADGIRINPGNIGGDRKVKAVVDCAKDAGIPIRIGVNAGSLEKDLEKKHHGTTDEAMVESALRQVERVAAMDFHQIKISIKASDVPRTISAYRLLSERTDYPLHLGITEAGPLFPGIVKSAIGIGMLLAEGIGDTIRVSLSRDPVEEVRVGYEILKALELRERGPVIVSCPTCGRCRIDVFDLVERTESALMHETRPMKIAVMGCVVNGPGEAKEADVGIAGGNRTGVLFKKGKVLQTLPQAELLPALLAEVEKIYNDMRG